MKIKKYFLPVLLSLFAVTTITSCLGSDDNSTDYTEWIRMNETYLTQKEDTVGADGKKVFEKITPVWAPSVYVLAQWHNDRSKTASNLVPMDNSTVEIKYEGRYCNGVRFDSSYSNPDSVSLFKPTDLIVGFHTMLTNMHVGDSVTCVIPSDAGYGTSSSGILPYSTLIFDIKLKSIYKYEVPNK